MRSGVTLILSVLPDNGTSETTTNKTPGLSLHGQGASGATFHHFVVRRGCNTPLFRENVFLKGKARSGKLIFSSGSQTL